MRTGSLSWSAQPTRPAYTGWASHDGSSSVLADSPSQSRHHAGPAFPHLAMVCAVVARCARLAHAHRTPVTSTAVTVAELAAQLRAGIDIELEAAVALRHELHAGAEPSGLECRTAASVAAALDAPDAPAVAGTGRLIRIGSPDGPCIALRAELDALPITEQTGVAWASQNGAMHACGHDVHLAALTAVGRAARAVEPRHALPLPLVVVLQPREEAVPS